MTIKPQEQMSDVRNTFNQPRVDKKLYRLVMAVYHDRTEEALELIKNDPDQINRQDPYSGLTPLNIAVFRQNEDVVCALLEHQETNIHLKDKFGRTAYEMLDYNSNCVIAVRVFDAFKPETAAELESFFYEDGPLDGSELAPEFRDLEEQADEYNLPPHLRTKRPEGP